MSGATGWLLLSLVLSAGVGEPVPAGEIGAQVDGAAPRTAPVLEPVLAWRDAWLWLEAVPPVLEGEEVRRQLDSGLSTTFVFRVEIVAPDGRREEGIAQVEVRFEPWDAVYFVTTLSARDGERARQLDSFESLQSWWMAPALPLFRRDALPQVASAGPWRAEVEVRVIPFSASEQEDARRWLARSLEGTAGAAEEVGRATDEQSQSLNRALQLLMATSIQRRPLQRFRWTVRVRPGRVP